MIIQVKVKPNSKKGPLIVVETDESLTVFVREVASDGQANEAVVKLLSKHYRVAKTKIELISGQTSKLKKFSIGE